MNLIKCSNNHFFDSDKFPQCPHCNISNHNPAQDNITIPANLADNGQGDVYTMPANLATAPSPVMPIVPPVNQDEKGTVPMQEPIMQHEVSSTLESKLKSVQTYPSTNMGADDDDQHTVGYYDTEGDIKANVEPVVGWLVGLNGEMRGRSITIHSGRSFIGRATTNDIVIEGDKSVSREKHAVIVFEPKACIFLLQPGTSRELFYLNGEVILETKKLSAYDKLEIGKTKLLFIPLCGDQFNWGKIDEDGAESNKDNDKKGSK